MSTGEYTFLSPNDIKESIKMRSKSRTKIFCPRWACCI